MAPRLIVPPDYWSGLIPQWVSPGTNQSQLRIGTGEAYVPGFGGLLEVKSPITPPVAAFVANNYYYVYLYNSGTTDAPVAAVELVTHSTAPDTRPTVYRGTARIKGTDNSRRYLFTVETNAEATPRMMNFRWQDGRTLFLETATRIMAGGTATAVTPVSFSSALPPHIRNAITLIDNNAPSPYLQVLSLNDAGAHSGLTYFIKPGAQVFADVPLNASLQAAYRYASAPPSSGAFLDIFGWVEER